MKIVADPFDRRSLPAIERLTFGVCRLTIMRLLPRVCASMRNAFFKEHAWPVSRGAAGSGPRPTAASKSSRNRSPLIVGSSSTTSGARSRTPRCSRHVGLLTPDECQQIVRGLTEIRAEIEAGRFAFVLEREDIHMHVEAALIDRIGRRRPEAAHRAEPQRPGGDRRQALGARRASTGSTRGWLALQRALVAAAERHRERDPARLHPLAAGQPVLAAHYFLAYVEKLARDRDAPGRLPQPAERAAPGGRRAGRHEPCRSTASTWPRRWGSTAWRPTAWMSRATATSRSSRSSS